MKIDLVIKDKIIKKAHTMKQNVTHYYFEKEFSNNTKNKLEKEFGEFLAKISGKLIHAEDLEKVKKLITEKTEELNQQHKRCKPIEVSFDNNYKGNIRVYGVWAINFYIKPAEIIHLSSIEYKSLSNN